MSRGPMRSNPSWCWGDPWHEFDRPYADDRCPDLTETENPVVARIVDGRGRTVSEVRERPTVPFGFHPASPTRRTT